MLYYVFYVYVLHIASVCYFSAWAEEGKLVETESIGNVFLIGINRPEKRNCVNQATAQQLSNAIKHFETDEEFRVAVLYGKGLRYDVLQYDTVMHNSCQRNWQLCSLVYPTECGQNWRSLTKKQIENILD